MSRLSHVPACTFALCLLSLLAAGCSEGGSEARPQSKVKLVANHHIAGIIGRALFAKFPVDPAETQPSAAEMLLSDDSSYQLKQGTTVLAQDIYALEENGNLSILAPQTNGPTHVFRGAYGLEGATNHLFFTDRTGNGIGLYMGTRVVEGAPDLEAMAGEWHLFSTHVLFADPAALPSVDEVGRAFGGTLTLGKDGAIDGTGVESTNTNATLPIKGDPANKAGVLAFQDGEFDLTIDYGANPATADRRTFSGGGTVETIFATDDVESDGAAGLMVMMKHRTAAVDVNEIAGQYVLGMWTVFLKPDASGFDAAIGTLELTAAGSFRVQARNNLGQDFEYNGTYTVSADDLGALTFEVAKTNETWMGAIDAKNDTVVIVDNFVEKRTSGQAELNFLVAIRPVPPKPN